MARVTHQSAFVLALAVISVLAGAVSAERDPFLRFDGAEGASVLEVTNETYADVVASHPYLLLEFTAHWCGRCKTIKKEYERAAEIAASLGLPVTVARFDAGKYGDFAKEHGVTSLPDFYLIRNGEPLEFPMLTTGEAFVAGAAKMLDLDVDISPVRVLGDDSLEVAQWIFWRGSDDGRVVTTVVLFVPEGLAGDAAARAGEMEAIVTTVAKEFLRFSNLRFAVTRSASMADFFELPTDRASLMLYKEHDEGRAEYTGPLEVPLLQDWVLRQDTPLVTLIWHRTLQGARKRVPKLALFFLTQAQFENPPLYNAVQTALQEIAYDLERRGLIRRGEFTIGIVDGEKYKSWLIAMGMHEGQLPAVGMEDTNSTSMFAGPDIVREALCTPGAEARLTSEDAAEARIYTIPEACPGDWVERVKAAIPPRTVSAEVGADGSTTGEGSDGGKTFEHTSNLAKLMWADVPSSTVTRFFEDALAGRVRAKPLSEGSKGAATPAPAAVNTVE